MRARGRKATVLRDLTPDTFRDALRTTHDQARRVIANFSREPVFHHGGGHYSPIGGYLEDKDQVFVLDVNARYGGWLVSRERLFAAIDTVDSMSGKKRGLLVIE